MAAQKHPTGLGRGLGELFQKTTLDDESTLEAETTTTIAGAAFREIPLEAISANPQQPRTVFDPDYLNELAESIKEVGLLQPIVVHQVSAGHYELVMGERRLRASKLAGLTAIPAIIRPTEAEDLLRDALLENIHRVQLNPLEEAAAYQQLLTDFNCTQEELAARLKKSRPQISNTIRLLQLPAGVQKRVAAGVLSAGHARALLGLANAQAMETLASKIVAEGMSVRATEEAVALADATATAESPKAPRPKAEYPRAAELAASLSDHFETRVRIEGSANSRGRIVIEFADDPDLRRILGLLG